MAVFKPNIGEVAYPDPMYYPPYNPEPERQADQPDNQVKSGLVQSDYFEIFGVILGASILIGVVIIIFK